ncbi:MAG: GntR family transcriptional regulator, transcriptional repressor for pyruvate dehydrogenase complex [Nocardioidaceae bacterium]|nr:GntR family transcriptional regulator, transcriptional repressor for pyruvate dehydrogenase complex [Nocardioidaceae bacterium]
MSETDPAKRGMREDDHLVNPFEQTLGTLVERIRSGELELGERLPPERELSELLGVSRTTLRAVIRALQQAGYIRTERGRAGGSVVIWKEAEAPRARTALSEPMKARLLDQLTYRSVLEPGAAALAAARTLTAAEEENLRERLRAVSMSETDFRRADADLHGYIAELSECSALIDAIANVQLILNERLLQIVPVMGPALDHSNQQHAAVVDAIISNDVEGARQIMSEHVGATSALIRTFLD